MSQDILRLSPDWVGALHALENHDGSIVLLGEAGTGKSTLVKHFLNTTQRNVLIFGSTGIAALEVKGMTVHRFFGIKPESFPDAGRMRDEYIEAMYHSDTIIIDEGPMLRADIIDALNETMQNNLDNPGPFGRKRIIFVGDFFQIGPVVRTEEFKDFNGGKYKSPYMFSSNIFKHANFACVELTTPQRQKDPRFLKALNNFRVGKTEQEDLDYINTRVVKPSEVPKDILRIFTRNSYADEENERGLKALQGEECAYQATISGDIKPTDVPVPERLCLKIGARVMLARNVNQFLSNGMCGTVIEMTGDSIRVRFDSGAMEVISPMTWESFKYTVVHGETEKEKSGEFTQFPLRLAYGITIHRSQGQTFDKSMISFQGGVFAAGQAYVALSRCRTLEGIYLLHPVKKEHFIVDKNVVAFMEEIRSGKYAMSGALRQTPEIQTLSPTMSFGLTLRSDNIEHSFIPSDGPRFYRIDNLNDSHDHSVIKSLEKFLSEKWTNSVEGVGLLVPDYSSGLRMEEAVVNARNLPDGVGAFIIGDSIYGVRFTGEKWEPFDKDENTALIRSFSQFPPAGVYPFLPELVIV